MKTSITENFWRKGWAWVNKGEEEREGGLCIQKVKDLRSIIPSTFYTRGSAKKRGEGGMGGGEGAGQEGRHRRQSEALTPAHSFASTPSLKS